MPTLASNQTCTGCGACDNICPMDAITIKEGKGRFLFPHVDPEKCIECKLCEKACPIVNGKTEDIKNDNVKECFAMWSIPDRTSSSSGGAFSAIARQVLAQGGKVYGAAWQDGFVCNHIGISNLNELHTLQGSKYLQSRIGNTFKEIRDNLQKGDTVLFTGTPCQVGGLKSFLRKDYDNLNCVDIVCHGVPSNAVFKAYINKLKAEFPKYETETGFEFRNRKGWGYAPHTTPEFKSHILVGVENAYMLAFEKSLLFRESCYDCQFNGTNRVGDITIADFWGIGQEGIPFKHDVTNGVSLVLANNDKGKQIISSLKDVFIEKREIEEAIKRNHNLLESSPLSNLRDKTIYAFLSEEITLKEICRDLYLIDNSIISRLKRLTIRLGIFYNLKSIYNKIRK